MGRMVDQYNKLVKLEKSLDKGEITLKQFKQKIERVMHEQERISRFAKNVLGKARETPSERGELT